MSSESDNHSPYLRGLKEKIGQGIDYLATEQNSEKSREKFFYGMKMTQMIFPFC